MRALPMTPYHSFDGIERVASILQRLRDWFGVLKDFVMDWNIFSNIRRVVVVVLSDALEAK